MLKKIMFLFFLINVSYAKNFLENPFYFGIYSGYSFEKSLAENSFILERKYTSQGERIIEDSSLVSGIFAGTRFFPNFGAEFTISYYSSSDTSFKTDNLTDPSDEIIFARYNATSFALDGILFYPISDDLKLEPNISFGIGYINNNYKVSSNSLGQQTNVEVKNPYILRLGIGIDYAYSNNLSFGTFIKHSNSITLLDGNKFLQYINDFGLRVYLTI